MSAHEGSFRALAKNLSEPEFVPLFTHLAAGEFHALSDGFPSIKKSMSKNIEITAHETIIDADHLDVHSAKKADTAVSVESFTQQAADFDYKMSQLIASYEEKLSNLRNANNSDVAKQVVASLRAIEVRVVESIGQTINDILEPFVDQAIRQKIIAEFSNAAINCMTRQGIAKTTVSAPLELHQSLAIEFQSSGLQIDLIAAPTLEVTAELNGTVLSTRFQHWAELLSRPAP